MPTFMLSLEVLLPCDAAVMFGNAVVLAVDTAVPLKAVAAVTTVAVAAAGRLERLPAAATAVAGVTLGWSCAVVLPLLLPCVAVLLISCSLPLRCCTCVVL
jgi:hypothetical protein